MRVIAGGTVQMATLLLDLGASIHEPNNEARSLSFGVRLILRVLGYHAIDGGSLRRQGGNDLASPWPRGAPGGGESERFYTATRGSGPRPLRCCWLAAWQRRQPPGQRQ